MLQYSVCTVGTHVWNRITYERALELVLCDFKDCDRTRDMLTLPNWICGTFCTISVMDVDAPVGAMAAMPGLRNLVPMGVEYDENGMRIK